MENTAVLVKIIPSSQRLKSFDEATDVLEETDSKEIPFDFVLPSAFSFENI